MKIRMLAAAAIAALALTACSSLQNFFDGGDGASELVVKVATMKYVEAAGKSPEKQAARAARVVQVAADVREVAKGDSITLAALEEYANSRLPEDLDPSDRLIAQALIRAVAQEVAERLGATDDGGLLDPDQLIAVETLLGWVSEVAGFYLAPA